MSRYLLRTDVVYAGPETSEELKQQARLRGLARQLGGLGGGGLVEDGAGNKGKKVVKKKLKGKAKTQEAPKAKSKSKLKDRSYGGSVQARVRIDHWPRQKVEEEAWAGRNLGALAGVRRCGADSEKTARGRELELASC